MRKLFKGGDYSKKETIRGSTVCNKIKQMIKAKGYIISNRKKSETVKSLALRLVWQLYDLLTFHCKVKMFYIHTPILKKEKKLLPKYVQIGLIY